jgi:flagellin-specific chaperone FliS
MQNQEIIQIIENLKGRRDYEEKKALKLGFTSLYSYFEDKFSKQEEVIEAEKKDIEEIKSDSEFKDQEKKTCSCC